jgi:hypothetical protein
MYVVERGPAKDISAKGTILIRIRLLLRSNLLSAPNLPDGCIVAVVPIGNYWMIDVCTLVIGFVARSAENLLAWSAKTMTTESSVTRRVLEDAAG